MAPPRLLVAVEERLLVGLQEEDAVHDARLVELVDHAGQRRQVLAAPRVGDHGGALDLRARVPEQLGQRADHLRRQVVDAEVARVLEHVHCGGLPGPRQAGDDHEVHKVRRPVAVG
jgi:hypothetical protein